MSAWESTGAVEHAVVYCLTAGIVSVPFVLGIVFSSGRLSVVLGFLWLFALLALLFDQIDELVTIRLKKHDDTGIAPDAD